MYLRHYGLRDKPFKLAHDPAYYYAPAHQVPLNELCYSIEEHQGLATVVGEPGTGKTTLLRRLLHSFSSSQRGVFISDAAIGGQSLVRQLATALGGPVTDTEKGRLDLLLKFLARETGKTVVLLIDEAQSLSLDQLEEVRHLTNLEVPGRKLVEIILAGQPSLEEALAVPELAGLRQRVAVRCRLEPLDLDHTRAYIAHRLRVAGTLDDSVFAPDAVKRIYEWSQGVPRLINIVCERSLLVGYVEEARRIDRAAVEDAIGDLKVEPVPDTDFFVRTAQPVSDGLLARVGSRLEVIEEKLDVLVQMLIRTGAIRPELAETPRARRWLEGLKRGESEAAAEESFLERRAEKEKKASEASTEKLTRAGSSTQKS